MGLSSDIGRTVDAIDILLLGFGAWAGTNIRVPFRGSVLVEATEESRVEDGAPIEGTGSVLPDRWDLNDDTVDVPSGVTTSLKGVVPATSDATGPCAGAVSGLFGVDVDWTVDTEGISIGCHIRICRS